MRRKITAIMMAMLLAFPIGTFGAVAPGGISIGGTNVMGDGAGFVGYVSVSGDIVTITATLRGPIYGLSCAKFGVKYNKDKVEVVAASAQPIFPTPSPISPTPTPPVTYQNSGFMSSSSVDFYASYTNIPGGMMRHLKYLNAQMMTTWCYAAVGIEKISDRYENVSYSPAAGSAFSATMKFRIKAGVASDLPSLKSYFTLSGDVSAPTLIEAGGKKIIAVAANFADAYVVPAIAHLDYTAIVAGDATPAPDASIANPTRKASPASSATFIAKDTMESGTPAGAISLPGDGPNALKVYGTDNRFLYLNHIYTTAAPRISYPFASPASGPFTMEFDYLPVAEATGSIALTISGKDNNGTSSEKWYVNMSISKSVIMNMTGNMAGNSGTVFSSANLDSDMLAGSPVARYRVCVYVKPEEQAYDIYVDDIKVSTASYEYRHKGVLASTASPDYPPVGEVKFTSLAISTSSAAATYKAGFDNIMAYGGAPELNIYEATKYYVSPEGNDSNPGTIDKPFLSMERARRVVSTMNSNMTQDITVYLAQGDYFIQSAMQFDTMDSGTNGHKIIYKNKDALGSARLIGGQNLSGFSQVDGSHIYKVNVGTGLTISNLYENEKVARVARHPNVRKDKDYPGYLGDYLLSESGDATGGTFIKYFENTISPASWTLTGAARIVWWLYGGYPDWGQNVRQISSIDPATRTINFSSPDSVGLTKDKDRFYIENVYELMDAPGEFFYDSATGWLYYYPMDGNPAGSTILLPKTRDIIKVTGSAVGTQAHDIVFEGLYLYGTMMDTGSSITGAGIILNHTNNIDITNCHFKNMGGHAIKMADDNEHNTVTGCWIEHTGLGGIWIYNNLNRESYPNNKSSYHLVSNNKIHDINDLYTNAVANGGVTIWDTNHCEVSYCEIFNSARYAISLRGHYSTQNNPTPDNMKHYAVDNTFQYIKIYNCGTDSGDMGALHAAHCNKTGEANINYWNQITIDNVTANPNMQDIKPNGIFLDHPHSCENQNLSNIKITNTQGVPYRTNVNPVQTLTNVSWEAGFNDSNMQLSSIGLKSDFPSSYGTSITATPAPESTTLPGEIVVDNSSAGYTETGTRWVPSTIGNTINAGARYNNSKSANESAKWTPNIPSAGFYDVYVWKFDSHSQANPAAKYKVLDAGGQTLYSVNQTRISGRWEKLGRHYFLAGTTGNVTLSCDVPGYVTAGDVRADAVKFVPVLSADASGYWAMNSGSGTTQDGTLNALHANLAGSPVYDQGGKQGAALVLDGINDAAQVADNDRLEIGGGDYSISLWFKRDANANANLRLISKGAESDTDIGYAIEGSDTTITAMLSNGTQRRTVFGNHGGIGKWNHVVVNFDREGALSLYVNGVCKDSVYIGDLAQSSIINAKQLCIGSGNAVNYWDGEVDEVRIYQRKLTYREISSLYMLDDARSLNILRAEHAGLYLGNQRLLTIPQSGGQYHVMARYSNCSVSSKTATQYVVVKNDNQLLSIKATRKTLGADETYTFDAAVDIPAYSSAPNINIHCLLWDGDSDTLPIALPLMISR